jgi:hypothetical protein
VRNSRCAIEETSVEFLVYVFVKLTVANP